MVAMVYYSATSGDVVLGIKHAKIIGLLVIVSVGVSLTSLPPRPMLRWAGPAEGDPQPNDYLKAQA